MNKLHSSYQRDLEQICSIPGIETIDGKTFLITGATGMVGTCLVDALMKYNADQSAGIKIIAVGRSRKKAASRLGEYYNNENFAFIEQDVREPFDHSLKADFILPLASNTHPLAYSQYPVETVEINIKGAENALKKAQQCNAMVLYPSTVEVYGNGDENFTEDYTGKLNLSSARSCYTESKRASEALCQSYLAEYGVRCKIARLSRIFGPTMLDSDTKASSQFIKKALAGEDIVLKSKGNQFFSYTYVADAVQAILFILIHGKDGEAYNIASNGCNVRLADFATGCASSAGTDVVFDIPSETEAKGYSIAARAILSTEKTFQLGWTAKYDFNDAILRTLNILK